MVLRVESEKGVQWMRPTDEGGHWRIPIQAVEIELDGEDGWIA